MFDQRLRPEPAADRSPAAKRALLAQLLEQRAARAQRHPLSFAQRRLWLTDRLQLGTDAYNVWTFDPLLGTPDVPAFVAALRELTRRQATLRTSFGEVDGEPYQIVAPGAEPEVVIVDLCALPIATAVLEARRLATVEAGRPFDLGCAPLLRTALFRLDAGEALVALVTHHIVSDAWSLRILVRELELLYQAFSTGKPSPLAELPIQYVDFVRWQRQWLQGEVLARHLAYWKGQLADAPVLEMPTDRPRPAVPSFRGASQVFTFPVNLHEAFPTLQRSEGTTAFMILLATIKALLFRYTNQQDLCIGSPFAGRPRQEFEGLIGYFVNMVVLRTRLDAETTFRDLVERVRQTTLDAYSYQELPFEKLVAELNPSRDAARSAFFQVAFSLQNVPDAAAAPDPDSNPLDVERQTVKFEMMFEVAEGPWGVHGLLEYNRDLFDRSTVQRLIQHARNLLRHAASKPDEPIGTVSLLTRRERHQLVLEWNDEGAPQGSGLAVHELFAEQVRLRPAATAVVCRNESLTYGELDRRAGRVARALRSQGLAAEEPVAIFAERSLEMVVALLGVLKAGGAYLPLDPSYPQDRLAWMLADSGTRVILTQRHLLDALPNLRAQVLLLAGEAEAAPAAEGEDRAERPDPDSLAYVIYTSGSTGRPKGVQITHRSLAGFLQAMAGRPGLCAQDTLFAITTLSFDIAALELLLPLTVGARVIVARQEVVVDGAQLAAELARVGASVMQATPATWRLLLASGWQGDTALTILCGGEALARELAAELLTGGAAVWNLYGPTETTVWAALQQVAPGSGPVPIGRALPGARLHVLHGLQPVGAGVVGEIYIGGDALARGYAGRPDLTAERFLPDPFGGDAGARLYRTGDRARWLADGRLDFLGRADHQVKVRGFRIELAEIEAALREHPAVRDAAVAVRDEPPEDRRLVAYVVLGSGQTDAETPLVPRLWQHLKTRLPAYMLPSAFVRLDRLPLTPNGKLDRRALPAPPAAGAAGEGAAAPRTLTEELVAGVWCEVLRLETVGIQDNFFALGGHSLLAAQVAARLRDAFGVEVPLRQLFDAPTVESLAAAVEAALAERTDSAPPPLVRVPRDGELPLSFAQERLWSLHRLDPDDATYTLLNAVRLVGPLRPAALADALAELVRRHEILRTSFAVGRGGRPVQVIAAPGKVELPVADLAALGERQGAEVRRLAHSEARLPFDLATGSPLRVRLLRLGENVYVLLVALHHIAADLWSLGVLLRDLVALYRAAAAGRPAALPELPIQYADYAAWQRRWLAGEVLETKLAYWREKLAGYRQVVALKTGGPGPRMSGNRGGRHAFRLPVSLSGALGALGRRQGATPYMTLLAAYEVLLFAHSGQRDLVIGSPSAGRRFTAMEGLIGFFLDTLPLRADLSGNPEFRELVAHTRQSALEAYAHQEVPLQRIVEALPARPAPLIQVWFAFQNVPFQEVEPSELRFSLLDVEVGSVPFELALLMQDTGDGLSGFFEYRKDVLSSAGVARMAEGFRVLLETAVARPQARVDELAELLRDSDGRHRRAQEKDYAAAVGTRLQSVQKRQVRRHVIKVRT